MIIAKKGDKGEKVKQIQELLCLHGFYTKIDSDYGPATEKAVIMFQQAKNINVAKSLIGVISDDEKYFLYKELEQAENLISIEPLELRKTNISFREVMLKVANFHLSLNPREVGGENMGPWVRFYTGGYEGKDYPWCMGFVLTIYKDAAHLISIPNNDRFEFTLSCDHLAQQARIKNLMLLSTEVVLPGYIFLIRKTENDWTHAGIVSQVWDDCIETIEGNTNDEGSREGYKVCKRYRSYNNIDFIKL